MKKKNLKNPTLKKSKKEEILSGYIQQHKLRGVLTALKRLKLNAQYKYLPQLYWSYQHSCLLLTSDIQQYHKHQVQVTTGPTTPSLVTYINGIPDGGILFYPTAYDIIIIS